jgi:pimeloyl-ACP methyl ester carboxylesterase
MTYDEAILTTGGISLFVRAAGSSRKTLMMEAGAGDTSEAWKPLHALLSTQFRTLAYDRAGAGKSPLPSGNCTFTVMSRHFAELVSSTAPSPPVFLVAHSLGAAISQLVVRDTPHNIVGQILIDPIPDLIFPELRRLLTPDHFALWLAFLQSPQLNPEGWKVADLESTLESLRYSKPAVRNLLVLSSGNPNSVPEEWTSWWPSSAYATFCHYSHKQLSNRYEHSHHKVLKGTAHYVHRDCPELVHSEIINWMRLLNC